MRTHRIYPILLGLGLIALTSAWAQGQTIIVRFVDGDLTGGNGLSWSTAYGSLQAALTAANPGANEVYELWVKGNSTGLAYKPGTNPTNAFVLKNDVRIYGGFDGSETQVDQRDPEANLTILSGDIGATDSQVVVKGNGTDSSARLIGFTIIGATEHGVENIANTEAVFEDIVIRDVTTTGNGAGMYNTGASPTLTRVDFINNTGAIGGAIYNTSDSDPVLEQCIFDSNRASTRGGAMANQANCVPTLRECAFLENTADQRGGAVTNDAATSAAIFVRCYFYLNEADGTSGDGGAIYNVASGTIVDSSAFTNNIAARHGGAVYADMSTVQPGASDGRMVMTNCVFKENAATAGRGGGVYCESTPTVITNATFNLNEAATAAGGGGLYCDAASPTVVNTILWENTANASDGETGQIGFSTVWPAVTYSCIQNISAYIGDAGNIGQDPAFADVDLYLPSDSPCVDAGNSGAVPPDLRDVDTDGDFDELMPSFDTRDRAARLSVAGPNCGSAIVDMGAYEYWPDCNGNQIPDDLDIDAQTSEDANEDSVPDECQDCNENSVLDPVEVQGGTAADCNLNCLPDSCEVAEGTSTDCDEDGVPDACQFANPGSWTTDADFDQGVLINVNHDASGRLERNDLPTPYKYVWIAVSARGTVVKINTETGAIEGEYRTSPHSGPSPSRTAVDLDGAVWVANREDNAGDMGSIVKIALPEMCACEDRNDNGVIETSTGLGDIRDWANAGGVDDDGGVETAEDECIVRYVRVPGTGTRALAINKENDIWVGGFTNKLHRKVDGWTGDLLGTSWQRPTTNSIGGYGAILDCNGTLWSAGHTGSGGVHLLRINPESPNSYGTIATNQGFAYGLAIDQNGKIWMTNLSYDTVQRLSSAGTIEATYDTDGAGDDRGVAVTPTDNDVWVANSAGSDVSRLRNSDGVLRKVIDLRRTESEVTNPTGIAVDGNGKVWVANQGSNTLSRIDPTANMPNQTDNLGAVDLTVDLGSGAGPYNYSDMTGMVTLQTTGVGTWAVIHEGGQVEGMVWERVIWNTEEGCPSSQQDNRLVIEVRAAETKLGLYGLAFKEYQRVFNNVGLSGVVGRFIQIRARLLGSCAGGGSSTPSLCDLRVIGRIADCCKGDTNGDGLINGADVADFVDLVLSGETCLPILCPADIDSSTYLSFADVPLFVGHLLAGPECSSQGAPRGAEDCNTNGEYDMAEILGGTSPDCNENLIPDACDLALATSADANTNGVPDECDPDCNTNDVPDDLDIVEATSADVNSDDVPDECEPDCNTNDVPDDWDIAQATSADCNTNGSPDECEEECNSNGVPDDCDITEGTSEDCNTNLRPDECDLSSSMAHSYDCNTNGVPDECDIAFGTSEDCNTNGYPDECDLATGILHDADTNGIPDECDGESLMGGGEEQSGMWGGEGAAAGESEGGGEAEPAFDETAAWEEFYEWFFEQEWGPDAAIPTDEQFRRMVEKQRELGLPLRRP